MNVVQISMKVIEIKLWQNWRLPETRTSCLLQTYVNQSALEWSRGFIFRAKTLLGIAWLHVYVIHTYIHTYIFVLYSTVVRISHFFLCTTVSFIEINAYFLLYSKVFILPVPVYYGQLNVMHYTTSCSITDTNLK